MIYEPRRDRRLLSNPKPPSKVGLLAVGIAAIISMPVAKAFATKSELPSLTGARMEPVPFAKLAGWASDDHQAAWQTWLKSCNANADKSQPLRVGVAAKEALVSLCKKALSEPDKDKTAARAFFETHFDAFKVLPDSGRGLFTGYYEPELEGSLTATKKYPVPIFDRPADLVTLSAGPKPTGLEGFEAARQLSDGSLTPYHDRTAIEVGALDGQGLERVFLADPVDRFFMQVQGSGRVRLDDGQVVRVAYAGRNGYPYTSIGKVVSERSGIPRTDMTMAVLRNWLAEDKDRAREVMRANKSFVFFRIASELDPSQGPIGAQGIPLTAGRSMAVDRTLWAYGLPIFVEATLPFGKNGSNQPFRRLMIAQDTGSAIVGPARGDLFMGSGKAAGDMAGSVHHPGAFVIFWPKDAASNGTP